jgi:hypothetical protein
MPLSRPTAILCAAWFLGLTAVLLIAQNTEWSLLPSLRPSLGGASLDTLWQVQSALVGIALPLLFVLMPLVRNVYLAVTRTAQLLMLDTLINPVLVFALTGVGWIGVVGLYTRSDPAVWACFLGVLAPSLVGVGYAYIRAARIIADAEYVARASQPLLLDLLDASRLETAARDYANGALVSLLNGFGIEPRFFSVDDLANDYGRGPAVVATGRSG